MRNPFVMMALAAAAMLAQSRNLALKRFEIGLIRARIGRSPKLYRPNGARECERRRAQIAKGTLTTHNGLIPANQAT